MKGSAFRVTKGELGVQTMAHMPNFLKVVLMVANKNSKSTCNSKKAVHRSFRFYVWGLWVWAYCVLLYPVENRVEQLRTEREPG